MGAGKVTLKSANGLDRHRCQTTLLTHAHHRQRYRRRPGSLRRISEAHDNYFQSSSKIDWRIDGPLDLVTAGRQGGIVGPSHGDAST